MNQRKADDAAVQLVVGSIPNESTIRKMTAEWSSGDFLYGIEFAETLTASMGREKQFQRLRMLLKERQAEESMAAVEAVSLKRHSELVARLDQIKAPRWTKDRGFLLTLVILVVTTVGTLAAIYSAFAR